MNEYNKGITGCGKKCPCRTWLSCPQYNSKIWKDYHPEQVNEDIYEWYQTNFRIKYEHGDSLGNG